MNKTKLINIALSKLENLDFDSAKHMLHDILIEYWDIALPISPAMWAIYKQQNAYPGNNTVFVTLVLSSYLMLDWLIDAMAIDVLCSEQQSSDTMEVDLTETPVIGIIQTLEYLSGISKISNAYESSVDYAMSIFKCEVIHELEQERRLHNIHWY